MTGATDDFAIGQRIIGRVAYVVSNPRKVTCRYSLTVPHEHFEMFSCMAVCGAFTLTVALRIIPRFLDCLFSKRGSIRHYYYPLSSTNYTTTLRNYIAL